MRGGAQTSPGPHTDYAAGANFKSRGGTVAARLAPGATMRRCTACQQEKPFSSFHRRSDSPYGVTERCRPCAQAIDRGRRRVSQAGRDKRASEARRRFQKYGITSCQFAAMRINSGDRCGVCAASGADQIDHNHETGRVRGILCKSCNLGIGLMADDPNRLIAAAEYVALHA